MDFTDRTELDNCSPGCDDRIGPRLEEGRREETDEGQRRQHLGPETEDVVGAEDCGLQRPGGQEVVDRVLQGL